MFKVPREHKGDLRMTQEQSSIPPSWAHLLKEVFLCHHHSANDINIYFCPYACLLIFQSASQNTYFILGLLQSVPSTPAFPQQTPVYTLHIQQLGLNPVLGSGDCGSSSSGVGRLWFSGQIPPLAYKLIRAFTFLNGDSVNGYISSYIVSLILDLQRGKYLLSGPLRSFQVPALDARREYKGKQTSKIPPPLCPTCPSSQGSGDIPSCHDH